MHINSFSFRQRVKLLVSVGAKAGIKVALWSSLLYVVYLILILIFTALAITIFPSSNIDRETLPQMHVDDPFSAPIVFIFVISTICFTGIVPAIIIGAIGGALIGLIFSFWMKQISNLGASFIGLIVGVLFILTSNYLAWQVIYGNSISFLEFIFPVGGTIVNPYTEPSVLILFISLYLGWKINKTGSVQLKEKQVDTQTSEVINVKTTQHPLP